MKKQKGIMFILVTMLLTLIFWSFVRPTSDIPAVSQYSQLFASFALAAFAWINFISTRNGILDNLFDGLDKSYIFHKYLSISALALVVVHNITISAGKRIEILNGQTIPRDPYAMYGSFSMYLFIALIVTALIAKKLNYERWKVIHKFMLIPYAFGIYHYYGSSNYAVLAANPYSIWLNIINLIGLSSVIYSVFFYERTSFKYHYKITKLEIVSNGTLELTGKALGKNIDYKPGQFAFFKLIDNENRFPSHPFTISEAPKKDQIQFTIKALGDHTKGLLNALKVGSEIAVSGPHGRFDFKTGSKNQIWIAGGIGVTPFRSFSQTDIPKDYSIHFFYAYNNAEDGAYALELQKLLGKKENINLHLINAKGEGFLTVDKIEKLAGTEELVEVYFCGPKPMRESLKKQFESSRFKVVNFNYEHFQFK